MACKRERFDKLWVKTAKFQTTTVVANKLVYLKCYNIPLLQKLYRKPIIFTVLDLSHSN